MANNKPDDSEHTVDHAPGVTADGAAASAGVCASVGYDPGTAVPEGNGFY